MNIFVYRNGKQEGPFGLDDLQKLGLTPDTLIWYKGLSEWTPASQCDATAVLFSQPEPPAPPQQPQFQQPVEQPCYQQPQYQQPYQQPQYQQPVEQPCYQQPYQQPQYQQPVEQPCYDELPPCPESSKTLAIVLTVLAVICCCNIPAMVFGILGISKGSDVSKRYAEGDIEGAENAAKQCKTFTLIGYIVWILGLVASFVYGFLSGLAQGF